MEKIRTGRARPGRVVRPKQHQEDERIPAKGAISRPNTRFTLFHSLAWDFNPDFHGSDAAETGWEGGTWLPEIAEIWHQPGANGVDKLGDATSAILAMQRKNCIVIFNGDPQMPEDLRNYLSCYDLKTGGQYWCLPSVEFSYRQGGRAVAFCHSRDWEYRFREALYAVGKVPAMSPDVLQDHLAILDEQDARDRRMTNRGTMTPDAMRERAAERDQERQALIAAYERQFAGHDGPTAGRARVVTEPQPEQVRLDARKPKPQPRGKGA